MNSSAKNYKKQLEKFFKEKKLKKVVWKFIIGGTTRTMDSDEFQKILVDEIDAETLKIVHYDLSTLDHRNGDIYAYLKVMATGYMAKRFGKCNKVIPR